MDTILIATDFSPAAYNASLYGVELAIKLNAKAVLFHSYQSVIPTADTVVPLTREELKVNSNKQILQEAVALQAKTNTPIECYYVEGRPSDSIVDAAKAVKAKYIVCGMKGSGRTMRKIFGSTVISLCRISPVPVVVVPENVNFIQPSSIVLASDVNDQTDMEILTPLQDFVSKFTAKVTVVRVIKSGMDEVKEKNIQPVKLKGHLKQLQPSFEFLNDNDVIKAINKFVLGKKIDMVAMVARKHNFLDRLFIKSHVEEMLFETSVPLFILPPEVNHTPLQTGTYVQNGFEAY